MPSCPLWLSADNHLSDVCLTTVRQIVKSNHLGDPGILVFPERGYRNSCNVFHGNYIALYDSIVNNLFHNDVGQ